MVTIILAMITSLRHKCSPSKTKTNSKWSDYQTSLYSGRVSHTRFQPVVHAFSYPLFFCCLDLKEVEDLFLSSSSSSSRKPKSKPKLWPLSLLMQFRTEDHLKNGEGLISVNKNSETVEETDLKGRIRNLIHERTDGKYKPSSEQTILLLTHLSYYGYCFNPVSFYYIIKPNYSSSSEKNQIEAIVAEVSNTPWNEMQCYVLHPDSKDVIKVQKGIPKKVPTKTPDSSSSSLWESVNYIFDKTFHVSPFMDMNHTYDWTFYSPTYQNRIVASTSMLKGDTKFFNAYFDIKQQTFTPMTLCYQLLRLPIYCAIVQIWIHIEAFRLFFKGVEFIPHPLGSETAASSAITFLMTPFFALNDWWKGPTTDNLENKKLD